MWPWGRFNARASHCATRLLPKILQTLTTNANRVLCLAAPAPPCGEVSCCEMHVHLLALAIALKAAGRGLGAKLAAFAHVSLGYAAIGARLFKVESEPLHTASGRQLSSPRPLMSDLKDGHQWPLLADFDALRSCSTPDFVDISVFSAEVTALV
jgi:hypothetical protein